jgi:hypothetical protein
MATDERAGPTDEVAKEKAGGLTAASSYGATSPYEDYVLLNVFRHLAQILIRRWTPSIVTVVFCTFGTHRRLVRTIEWLTL